MSNLEQKKASVDADLALRQTASDLAYSTLAQTGPVLDAAIADYASAKAISDANYLLLKSLLPGYRQQYLAAQAADARAAAQAAAKPAPAIPAAPKPAAP